MFNCTRRRDYIVPASFQLFHAGVCAICWILCQFMRALIDFPIVLQWKRSHLLDTKQSKFTESSTLQCYLRNYSELLISFSSSFRQYFCKIIGWHTFLVIWRPLLENPGSATGFFLHSVSFPNGVIYIWLWFTILFQCETTCDTAFCNNQRHHIVFILSLSLY